MTLSNYIQPQKSIAEQIALLRLRELHIDNEERVRHVLQNISLYRLRSYMKPFKKK
jgi:abortive infection bacteriophage resistance protein